MITKTLKGKRFIKCPHCMHKFVLKLAVEKGEISEEWEIHADGVQINSDITIIALLDEIPMIFEEQRKTIKVLEEKIEELEMALEADEDY